MPYTHNPAIFDQEDYAAARGIVVTPEMGLSTDERWKMETEYLLPYLDRIPEGPVLDYGCGPGRLSEALNTYCLRDVIGVDTSHIMLQHAMQHLSGQNFAAMSPRMFNVLRRGGLQVSGAFSVWVLQHIPGRDLPGSLATVARALPVGAPYIVVNNRTRFIPAVDEHGVRHWVSDGVDLDAHIIGAGFALESEQDMPGHLCHDSWLRVYRRTA
jgi:SAM-dependent methyltransferase